MTLRDDTRGVGIIRVLLLFVASMFALWILTLVVGGMLEPIYQTVQGFSVVESEGYGNAVGLIWPILSMWAPLAFGVGMIVLTILYAVFRERFAGPGRPRY